jgi:putative DNA primase/helicase
MANFSENENLSLQNGEVERLDKEKTPGEGVSSPEAHDMISGEEECSAPTGESTPPAPASVVETMEALHGKGICVLPLKPGTKAPGEFNASAGKWVLKKEWSREKTTDEDITRWRDAGARGLGVHLGAFSQDIVGVDIDTDDEKIISAILAALPPLVSAKKGKKGLTVFYRRAGARSIKFPRGAEKPFIDFIAQGGFCVLPPSPHMETKQPYVWVGRSLVDVSIGELPALPDDYVTRIDNALTSLGYPSPAGGPQGVDGADGDVANPFANFTNWGDAGDESITPEDRRAYALECLAEEKDRLTKAKEGGRNTELNKSTFKMGQLAYHKLLTKEEVEAAFEEAMEENGLLKKGSQRGRAEFERTFKSGWDDGLEKAQLLHEVDRAIRARSNPLYALSDRHGGDVAIARRFAREHAGAFRYVRETKTYRYWNGVRWMENGGEERVKHALQDFIAKLMNEAHEKIMRITRARHNNPDALEAAKKAYSALVKYHSDSRKLKAVASIVYFQPGMSSSALDYDKDPYLLGVQNGVVDLTTGELREPDPELYITKLAGCAYKPGAQCPEFLAFLERVQPDPEMREHLQRRAGYTLTGSVEEEKLFFDIGGGDNGKSVFLNIMTSVMGDYKTVISTETLMTRDKNNSEAKREKTKLVGVRLASANEVATGSVWNDMTIKELVSTEDLAARKLHAEGFDFRPTHKLWIRGNNEPGARDTSEGFWKRMIKTKWGVRIPEEEIDRDLCGRIIKNEIEGVLAWAVRGAVKWRKDGLKIPASITDEIKRYRKESDIVGKWIEEATEPTPGGVTPSGELYESYACFCKLHGFARPFSSIALGRELSSRGYEKGRVGRGLQGFYGIRPLPHDEDGRIFSDQRGSEDGVGETGGGKG